MKQMTFVAAMRNVFGQKHGQTLQQFGEELKQLDDKDRQYFAAHLLQHDIQVIESPVAK